MAELEANFSLENNQNIDALFEIYAAGTTWGNISGNMENQTDLKNVLDTMSGQIDSNHGAITEIALTMQGYGNIVTYSASDFATAAQGTLASTALQPGNYVSQLVNDAGYITTASLPTVNNSKITIQKNSTDVASFTLNQASGQTINIAVPTKVSELSNDSGFITGITSGDVTTALGFTPYDSSNPAGYITSADLPTNYVTTNTAQTISAQKNWSGKLNILNNSAITGGVDAYTTYALLQRNNTSREVIFSNGGDKLRLRGSETRPQYNTNDLALYSDVTSGDSALQAEIDVLKARGRFLALWDCSTGLAESNPPTSPYTYQSGDYFIVGTVSTATPPVNYKPTGSSYTTGVASTVVETETVEVDDVYYYDGTNWRLQVNTRQTVSFVNIAGSPYDNTNLATALNAKADTSSLATVATTGEYSDLLNTPTIPTDTSDLTNGAKFVSNNGTGTNALALGNTSQSTAEGGVAIGSGAQANSTYATAVGQNTRASNTNTTVIGRGAKATQARAIAIGSGAEATAQDAIAIKGVNNTANTLQVYTYTLLDMATGLIPDARISSNIARTSAIPTDTSDLTNGAGYITGITSGDVTTALGFTPVNKAGDTMTGDLNIQVASLSPLEMQHTKNYSTETTAGNVYQDIIFRDYTNSRRNIVRGQYNWDSDGLLTSTQITLGTCGMTAHAPQGIQIKEDSSGITAALTGDLTVSASSSTSSLFIATTGWVNDPTRSTNVVHRSNDETINGNKTFKNLLKVEKNGTLTEFKSSDIDFSTAPASNTTVALIAGTDKNGNRTGRLNYIHRADGSHCVTINDKQSLNDNNYSTFEVGWDSNGVEYTSVPHPTAASNSKNIATTQWVKNFAKTSGSSYMSTFSKAANGYYKFTNGLIIQWGSAAGMDTVTLPTAFTSANYKVVISPTIQPNGHYFTDLQTTTAFDIVASTFDDYNWVAIGY